MNLAAADAATLADALIAHYRHDHSEGLETYSETCLARVWRAVRFSWWFTQVTHRLEGDPFAAKLQAAELADLAHSRAAATALAENYVGRFSPASSDLSTREPR